MPPCDVTPARFVVFEQLGAGGRRENNENVTKGFSAKSICTECVGLLHTNEFRIGDVNS